MGLDETLNRLPQKIDSIVLCMMIGTLVSFLVCVICFPETASQKTQNSMVVMMDAFIDIIDFSNLSFLSKMVDEPVTEDPKILASKLKILDLKLTSISNSRFETCFEPFSRFSRKRLCYNKIISSMESLILHFASLTSTISSMWVLKDVNEMNQSFYKGFFTKSFQEIRNVLFQDGQCVKVCSHILELEGEPDQDLQNEFEALHKNLYESLQVFQSLFNSELSILNHDLDMKTYQIYFFVFGVQEITREILNLMDSIQGLFDETPQINSIRLDFKDNIYSFFKDIKLFQIRFALKTAFAITLMGIPAFLNETKHNFYRYRLSWAMSSTIVVLTYSVGGTSSASWYRILGTIGGVMMSIIIWLLFPDNAIGLLISLGCISVPSFYFRFNSKYPKVAQVSDFMSTLDFSFNLYNYYSSKVLLLGRPTAR